MKLGIDVHERTVSKIIKRIRTGKPPSQTWRTFLKNHMFNTFVIDFFVVPTTRWTARQIVEACPWNTLPKYLLRDRDSIYGEYFQSRIQNMGINEVKTAPQSPWHNPPHFHAYYNEYRASLQY